MRMEFFLLFVALLGVAAVGCTTKSDTASTQVNANTGEDVSDRDRLQGVWKIELIDSGDFKRESDKDRGDRFQFEGDRLTRTETKDDSGEKFIFTLDLSKDPKWMTLRRMDPNWMPIPATPENPEFMMIEECIYRFENETLIVAGGLAISNGKSSRPTEFKARSWAPQFGKPIEPGVILWRLKKTNESIIKPIRS